MVNCRSDFASGLVLLLEIAGQRKGTDCRANRQIDFRAN